MKKTIVLVDGENIGCMRAEDIDVLARRYGTVVERRVYHRGKDPATRNWTEKAKNGLYKDIRLDGGPEKDKIDRKIQKDARHYMRSPKYARVCIVSSDGGFCCLAKENAAPKKLRFIGEKKAPRSLRNTCAPFLELS